MKRQAVVTICAATATALCVGAAPAAVAGAPPAGLAPAASTEAPAASDLVTLPTGQQVRVTEDGAKVSVVQVDRQKGPLYLLSVYRRGGDTYIVPDVAKNYLGRYLDRSMFELETLRSQARSGRIPVRLGYTGDSAPHLPGVTIDSASHGRAEGHLSFASAKKFGAALARQAIADSRAGWPVRSPLFGNATSMAPVGDTSGGQVNPHFQMNTVVFDVTDHKGRPLSYGQGGIMNADDARKYNGAFQVVDGVGRLSVPTGHYILELEETNFAPDGVESSWLVTKVDVVVDKNMTTVKLDARDANATLPKVVTPKRARTQHIDVAIDGYSDDPAHGGFTIFRSATPPQSKLHLTPTPNPEYGVLKQYTTYTGQDPRVAGGRYKFDAGWAVDGIRARQRWVVPAVKRLDTTKTTYYADVDPRYTSTAGRLISLPDFWLSFGYLSPTPTPLKRTEYTYGPAGTAMQEVFQADPTAADRGEFYRPPAFVTPGSKQATSWMRSPLVNAPSDVPAHASQPSPSACQVGDLMQLYMTPVDGDPTHYGQVQPSTGSETHFTLTADGQVVADIPDGTGGRFTVPTGTTTYEVNSTIDRSNSPWKLGTLLTTDVTFRSNADSGTTAPSGWACGNEVDGVRLLPILRGDINIHPDRRNLVAPGTRRFDIRVGHVDDASSARVKKVSMEYRRTGTSRWHLMPVVKRGNGNYRAWFASRPRQRGQVMDLRLTATDSAGGILHQTTQRAFMIGD